MVGCVLALVMYAISVSPSLLPRQWWWQAFVSGVLMALGYAVGWLSTIGLVFFASAADIRVTADPELTRWLPALAAAIFLAWLLRAVVMNHHSAGRAATLVSMRPMSRRQHLLAAAGAFALFALIIAILQLLLYWGRLFAFWLHNWLPLSVSVLLAALAGAFLVLFVSNRVVFRAAMILVARIAESHNARNAPGIKQPQQPERSGSAVSLTAWQEVGNQGRIFLSTGPSAAQIADVTGQPSCEPVRVYAGLTKPTDFSAQAARVVAEMHRTGAFEREAILLCMATGSGWVDEWLVEPFEYLTRGNCATASMQYSFLFSAALMVTDTSSGQRAAQVLFEAVNAELQQIPAAERPRLYVAGESLGAEAIQHAFDDFAQMAEQVDGALLVGSPEMGPIVAELTADRNAGSPQVAPVYDAGRQVRFVSEPDQLGSDVFGRPYGAWEHPRVLVAQHASDAAVWYTPRLAWQEPDWLRERVGLDVSPDMHYTRVATFLQVLTDLPVAGVSPAGHGHTYHEELVPYWRWVLGLEDAPWLTEAVLERVGDAVADEWEALRERRAVSSPVVPDTI